MAQNVKVLSRGRRHSFRKNKYISQGVNTQHFLSRSDQFSKSSISVRNPLLEAKLRTLNYTKLLTLNSISMAAGKGGREGCYDWEKKSKDVNKNPHGKGTEHLYRCPTARRLFCSTLLLPMSPCRLSHKIPEGLCHSSPQQQVYN